MHSSQHDHADVEHFANCPFCGDPIDYCQGHSEDEKRCDGLGTIISRAVGEGYVQCDGCEACEGDEEDDAAA